MVIIPVEFQRNETLTLCFSLSSACRAVLPQLTAPRRKQRKQSPRITVNHSKVEDFDIAQIGYYLAHMVMI